MLRLWVASVDYNSDVLIGDRILSQVLLTHAISHPPITVTDYPLLYQSQVAHASVTSQPGVWSLM